MKRLVLSLLLISATVSALDIDLLVQKTFAVETRHFEYNSTSREFFTEIFNPGSLAFTAQIRTDVVSNGTAFRAFSMREQMMPGNNGVFRLYWFPESPGKYTVRQRIYYGSEINESTYNITVDKIPESGDIFNITSFEVVDNFIIMNIAGSGKAVVMPEYPDGWWIAQRTFTAPGTVIIPYSAPAGTPLTAKFIIASPDGQYASKRTVRIEKSSGFREDVLRLFYSMLY